MEDSHIKIGRKRDASHAFENSDKLSQEDKISDNKRLALYFYDKFKSIAGGVEKMKYIDIIEIIFSQNDDYRQLYLEILEHEIKKTDLYLKKVKQQRELAINKEWTIITINGKIYVKRKSDMFAYKSDNLQMPVYMWNGCKWILLVSDPSALSDILDF